LHLYKPPLVKASEPPAPALLPQPPKQHGICLNPRPLGTPLVLPPIAVVPADDSLSRLSALSLLHDLAIQMDTERADAAALVAAGWSESFANEFCHVIRQLRN